VTVKVPLWEEAAPLKETVVSGKGANKLLLLDISGFLMEQSPSRWLGWGSRVNLSARIKEELQKAARDDRIKGLILRINSPGGTVTAADLIYHELAQFKKEHGLKIVACVTGLAASGGYYVAQAADQIVAQPTALIGSIGVLALKFNIKGLLDKLGVDTELVKTGKLKDLWSPFRPGTPEEERLMQGIINDFYQRFVTIVAENRRISRQEVLKYADGRIFTAGQAQAGNLIDRIGYLEDAITLAQEIRGLEETRVVMYHRPDSYRNNIYSQMLGDQLVNMGNRAWQPEALPGDSLPDFLYLWWPESPR
jgi:protease-4